MKKESIFNKLENYLGYIENNMCILKKWICSEEEICSYFTFPILLS